RPIHVIERHAVAVDVGQNLVLLAIGRMNLDWPAFVHSQAPLGDVEVMRAPVAHHPTGVVTDEAPAAGIGAAGALEVVGRPWGGTEPAIPIQTGRDRLLGQKCPVGGAADVDVDAFELADALVSGQLASEAEIV